MQGVVSLKEHPEAFEAAEGPDAGIERDCYGQDSGRAAGAGRISKWDVSAMRRWCSAWRNRSRIPIQLKEHGVDFLLDQRHLWIRTPRQAAILRIRAEADARRAQFHGQPGIYR